MAANGYESYFTIINLGSATVLFILTIAIPLLLILIYKPFKSRSKYALENHNSLTNAMHGNILLRFIIETCLDISISVILQLYYSDKNDGLFNSSDHFLLTNSMFTVILGPATLIFMTVMFIFYVRKFKNWGDEDFDEKYGAVFEGLRKETKLALLYPAIFIVRRVLFAVAAILFPENVFVQISCLFVFSTLQIMYLVEVRPFEHNLMQGLEIFNEFCTLGLTYILMCLTSGNVNLWHSATYYDYAFLSGMGINLSVHVFLLIKDSALSIKDKIKAKLCKSKA